MRIAIFTNNYLPNPYGVSMSIEGFRRELEKMGHTVYVFAPKFKGYADSNPNVYRFPSLDISFRGVRYPVALPFSYEIDRILKNLQIDIIHAQHPNLLGWQAKRWAKKKNIPLIFTWHTLYDQYAHFVPLMSKKITAWSAIKNARDFANKCDQIIIPTPSVKSIIEKWGVTNKNISSITSGVDECLFENPDGSAIRKKYLIAKDETLLLLISRLTAEKNVKFIFDSLIPLISKNKKLKFIVCGGGNLATKLEEVVGQNDLSKNIFFAGIVPADEVKNYYAAADIFVHASKSETQGMIITEAMYAGLPIVSVRASGACDLIGNFVTGILTNEIEKEFAAAVEKLAGDQELRKKYSENTKRIAKENYTSEICTKKMLEVYESAINRKKNL